MAIVDTLNKCAFMDGIQRIRPEDFSYEAREALFEYYEQLSEDMGEDIEFDPISICCEWTEYADLEALKRDYPDVEDFECMNARYYTIELTNGGLLVQEE